MKSKLFLSVALFVLGMDSMRAAVIVFTNRAQWEAAVGPRSFVETFEGFTTDTPFRTSSVAANGFNLQQEGTDKSFRNEVDTAPLHYSDNNGTKGLSLYTNFHEESVTATTIRLTFYVINLAFGGESYSALESEGVMLDIMGGTKVLGSIPLANASASFRGYLLTDGDFATSVVFRSASLIAGKDGEGFGYDNVAGVSLVPEPSGMMLSLVGLIMMGLIRHRNKQLREHEVVACYTL